MATCFLAVVYSHSILAKPTEDTFRLFFIITSVSLAFIEPFAGLIEILIFIYFRPQEFIPGLVRIPLMLIIESITLVFMLIQMAGRKRYGMLFKVPQDFLMLWFFAAIGISNLANFYVAGITESLNNFASTLILYFLIVHLVNSTKRLKITMYIILTLTIILAVQGIVQHFTGVGLGGQTMTPSGRIRSLGIFSDPNDLGVAMLIMIPFIFLSYIEKNKALAAAGIGLFAYALFLTLSRGSMLSLGVIMILLLTKRYGKVVGIVSGTVIIAVMYVFGPGRLAQLSVEDDSAFGRVEAWSTGLTLFVRHPIFGVGAQRFTDYHYLTAHNSFVLCASELGLFGVFPWLMLILLSMRNNFFIAKQSAEASYGELSRYASSLFYGLIAFAFASFFLSRTYNELLYILVGLSVAVSNIFLSKSTDNYRLWEKIDVAYTLILIVGLFFFIKVFLLWAWWSH